MLFIENVNLKCANDLLWILLLGSIIKQFNKFIELKYYVLQHSLEQGLFIKVKRQSLVPGRGDQRGLVAEHRLSDREVCGSNPALSILFQRRNLKLIANSSD